MQVFGINRRLAAWALLGAMLLGGCDADLTVPITEDVDERAAVVLNRGDRTLTTIVFAADDQPRTLQLGAVSGLGDLAIRDDRALVPVDGAILVVNLRAGVVERRIFLPTPPDGHRVLYVGDTLALAASSGGTITAFNPLTGRASAPTRAGGTAPLEMVQSGPRIFVLNAPPAPAAPFVTLLDTLLNPLGTVTLGGINPRAMVLRGSMLYVLHAGLPGTSGGSLSLVEAGPLRETAVVPGFGESPASLAFSAAGELYVAVPGRGLLVFDPATRRLTRGLDAPLVTGGLDRVSRLVADPAGFVYALQPGACDRAGTLVRLGDGGVAAASIATGVCPVDVDFTALPRR